MPTGDKLTKDDKIRSLINVFNTLSTDKDIRKKQLEILEFFWDNYIHGCEYFLAFDIYKRDKEFIYSLNWNYFKDLDKLKEEIDRKITLFLKVRKALLDELSKIKNPSYEQRSFVNDFAKYKLDWFTEKVEYFVKIFNNPSDVRKYIDPYRVPGFNDNWYYY